MFTCELEIASFTFDRTNKCLIKKPKQNEQSRID